MPANLDVLQSGAKVAVVAPSFIPDFGKVNLFIQNLENAGYQVVQLYNPAENEAPFAANVERRLYYLQTAINDPDVKAIFCLRGGYGLTQILPSIDFSPLHTYPKWLVGFSDVTALHIALNNQQIPTLHAPMATGLANVQEFHQTIEVLKNGNAVHANLELVNGPDELSPGPIVGGNLSLICATIGTQFQLNCEGKYLFLEEVGERHYKISRLFDQIIMSEMAKGCLGILPGHFSEIQSETYPYTIRDQLVILGERLELPIIMGVEAGHSSPNYPLLLGVPTYFERVGDTCQIVQNFSRPAIV